MTIDSIVPDQRSRKEASVIKLRLSFGVLCTVACVGMTGPAWGDFQAGMKAHQKKEYAKALREFKADGKAQANYIISTMYYNGEGVKQDRKEAVKWMRKAAEQGHVKGQFVLSTLYFTGDGVDQNIPEAVKWIKKSAENGFDEAQFNLGMMYINGDNIDKDRKQGIKWVKKAAKQEHVQAKKLLSIMGESGAAPKGHSGVPGH